MGTWIFIWAKIWIESLNRGSLFSGRGFADIKKQV